MRRLSGLENRILIYVILVFLMIAIVGAGILLFVYFVVTPVAYDATPILLPIAEGEGGAHIANRLEEAGVIRSAQVFRIYSLLVGHAPRYQPGMHRVSANSSIADISAELLTGARELVVTIPEGFTSADIRHLLVQKGVIPEDVWTEENVASRHEFIAARHLEGYLFPDTYRVVPAATPERIMEKMVQTFKEKALPLFEQDALDDLSRRVGYSVDAYDVLIMASLIEKEVYHDDDRSIVSDVLWKRIAASMPLQVDATISYAKCDRFFVYCEDRQVRRSELEFDSHFNTYRFVGLPPTPIANPGVDAIRAALNPVQSPYWFYLSDDDTGDTIFSRTLDEHNWNRAKYLGI